MAANALNGYSISDQTGLKGAWDFDITFRSAVGTPVGQEPLSFFDAMPKQLGLDFALSKVPLPAIVVDSVNPQPTTNPANLAETLPKLPADFEVAVIKPVAPDDGRRGYTNSVQPGGRVLFNNIPLGPLIQRAWDLPNRESLVGPGFLETEHVDVVPLAATPDSRLTLSEAVESQLGLGLETTKRPGPVFIIDRMERKPLQ